MTPRPFPGDMCAEIQTAPDPYPEIWTVIDWNSRVWNQNHHTNRRVGNQVFGQI